MSGRDRHAARGGWLLVIMFGLVAAGTGDGLAASDAHPWGPDPFGAPPAPVERPLGETHLESESPIELQGIIAGPNGMVAIIDSTIVRIGDHIGSERVLEITPRMVVLQHGQQTRRLALSVLVTRGR